MFCHQPSEATVVIVFQTSVDLRCGGRTGGGQRYGGVAGLSFDPGDFLA